MSDVLRRIEIPIALTIIATLLQVLPYYLDIPALSSAANTASNAVLIIVACATFVGVISILQVHGKRVQKQSEGWYYSILVIAFTAIMAITGLPIPEIGLSVNNSIYNWLFTHVQTPLGSTMYSIIAFFITSAAFRAFRAKNLESTIVLVAGTIMVLGNAPLVTNYIPIIADISLWIRTYPNMATMRGVMIGAALGSIALAVRTLMGIERGYLRGGGGEE
jgi:membrane-associated HD superfamily phosphohydrolase